MGLKCGGVGLNLTAANRVYSLDPWWNSAMEHQAFARVIRLGQEKMVRRYRIMIAGSVDVRIELLQRSKASEVTAAMRDDKKYTATLTLDQLQQFFPNQPAIRGDKREDDVSAVDNTYFQRTLDRARKRRRI